MKHMNTKKMSISFTKNDTMHSYTVNDGLSALVAYL